MRAGYAGFWRSSALLLTLLGAMVSTTQATDGCWFSDLRWSEDGESLVFLAGQGRQIRTLQYHLETGNLACIDPQVSDPVWGKASGRVLFRDQFGIFETRVDSDRPPRMVVFLPEASQHFLRDFGEDNRGQPMVWTYDRRAARHSIVTLAPEGAFALPGALPGGEARRAWQERNQAQRFQNVGGMYVRSACFQRPRRKDQLCFENIGGSSSRRSPLFRITMGPPGGVQVLQNRCAPSAMVQSRDSTQVILGVYEEVDRQGQSEVLSCWVADWRDARRVSETLLPALVDVRERQSTFVHWLSPGRILWVDAVGQLLAVDMAAEQATPLVSFRAPAERSPMHRVVLGIANNLEEAQEVARQLNDNGLDAGIQSVPRGYEVQVGAWSDRDQALQRADFLQGNGWPGAHVREGSVEMVAADMGFEWLPRRSGEGVFVRMVQGVSGTFAELWWAAPQQEPRRLIPSFEDFSPVLVGR